MAKRSLREKRSRWSVEQARAIVAECESSGLSVQSFAERRGFEAQRLYRWKRKFERCEASVEFVEVKAEVGSASFELVLSGSRRLLIHGSVDAASLRTIVVTLEQEC